MPDKDEDRSNDEQEDRDDEFGGVNDPLSKRDAEAPTTEWKPEK